MSGIATATGIAGATLLAGVGAAATVASALNAMSQSGSKASGAAAQAQVNNSQGTAMAARSQLLETAGGSGGDPLAPGQVGGNKSSVFGN